MIATVRSLDPDLLLIDIEVHYAVIVTASLGIPTALATNFFSPFRLPGLPPLHTDIQPGSAYAIDAAWRRARAGAFLRRLGDRFGKRRLPSLLRPVRFGTYGLNDIRALARVHGFNLRARADRSQWLRPHVYRDLPIVCYNAEAMELPHDPPAHGGHTLRKGLCAAQARAPPGPATSSSRARVSSMGRPITLVSLPSIRSMKRRPSPWAP